MALDLDSPKERFQKSKELVEGHRAWVSNPQFLKSIEAALLQFQHDSAIRVGSDLNAAAAEQFKQVGAHEFVRLLINFSEAIQPVKRPSMPQLHPV